MARSREQAIQEVGEMFATWFDSRAVETETVDIV